MSYPYDPNAPQEPQPGGPVPPPYAQQPPLGAQPPMPPAPSYPTYGAPGGMPPVGGMPPMSPYGGGTSKNNLGVWALVLGILSIVCFGFLAGIPALIVGRNGQKAADQGLANNRGMSTAGVVLGIVSIAWTVIAIIIFASRR
ncbi:MAG: DUF4190 domain-containing protein [Micrococcales bacterium]|nr:DUF4190 domain-containing protein [Micrococcales bacterium]